MKRSSQKHISGDAYHHKSSSCAFFKEHITKWVKVDRSLHIRPLLYVNQTVASGIGRRSIYSGFLTRSRYCTRCMQEARCMRLHATTLVSSQSNLFRQACWPALNTSCSRVNLPFAGLDPGWWPAVAHSLSAPKARPWERLLLYSAVIRLTCCERDLDKY